MIAKSLIESIIAHPDWANDDHIQSVADILDFDYNYNYNFAEVEIIYDMLIRKNILRERNHIPYLPLATVLMYHKGEL